MRLPRAVLWVLWPIVALLVGGVTLLGIRLLDDPNRSNLSEALYRAPNDIVPNDNAPNDDAPDDDAPDDDAPDDSAPNDENAPISEIETPVESPIDDTADTVAADTADTIVAPPSFDERIEPEARIASADIPEQRPRLTQPSKEAIVEKWLYVVIDDVGYDSNLLTPFLQTGIPMTFAILPQLIDSLTSAEIIQANDMDIIMHLPMEPIGDQNPGPGAIMIDLDATQIADRLEQNLASVPGARGINNHMGSLATSDLRIMSILFELLESKRLYFLDSRTSHLSVGREIATQHDITYLERNVFIDHEPHEAFIRNALDEGIQIAERNGHSILIGHVGVPLIAHVLAEREAELRADNYRFGLLHQLSENSDHDSQ